jgi:hypothetical protein
MCFFAIVVVPFMPFSSFFNYSFKNLVTGRAPSFCRS